MRYHLSYNQDPGALCIDETGATIQTVGTEHFHVIFSSDNIYELMRISLLINSINAHPFENKPVPFKYFKTILNADLTDLKTPITINLCDL